MNPSRANHLHSVPWAITAILLLVLFYLLTPILTPFVVAMAFAYLCDPAVNWLVRHRIPRRCAVGIVILGMGLAVLLLILILLPTLIREGSLLLSRLPELIELFQHKIAPWLNNRFGIELSFDVPSAKAWLANNSETAKKIIPSLLSHAREGGSALITLITTLLLIPIVMFYLLHEWPRITHSLKLAIPRPMLTRTLHFIHEIDRVLSEFLRGQLAVMLVLALFYCLGLWLAGLHFALPIGILTGLLAFVPFVGFGSGLLLSLLAALLQSGGLPLLAGVGIVYSIGQLLESYALTPYLVGKRIGLHPLAIIFALLAFGQLFGFVGMLIALPASATILVGLRELRNAWYNSTLYLGTNAQQTPSQPQPNHTVDATITPRY